jgi:hypothetical protein
LHGGCLTRPDGFSNSLLYHIVDQKCSEAIRMANKHLTTKTKTDTKRMRQTTVGWIFLVEWANSSRQWIDLKILKESNPAQVAEYAIARNIGDAGWRLRDTRKSI